MLQDHLKELERELDVEISGKPNEPGAYTFVVDPELEVEFKDLDEGIFLLSQISEVPRNNKEDLFVSLSEANLLGVGTKGSVFGLTKDLKYIVINHLIEQDVSYQEFHDILEDFVNIAKIYQDEIKSKS
jgi:hypothetical protein